MFGSGSDSLRDALRTLASIDGQLDLVSRLTDSLDSAGSFATIIGQMEEFSRGLVPEGDRGGALPDAEDYWLNEVRKVTSGRFFQPEAKKTAPKPTSQAPDAGPAAPIVQGATSPASRPGSNRPIPSSPSLQNSKEEE
jgi:hypothetical protein